MRIAVIGVGVIGKVHIKIIQETDNELVAICDTDEVKLSLFPEIKGYTDYITMFNDVKPDCVHICTPHYLHTEMIVAALQRDIHTLCEKPLCIKETDIPLVLEAEKHSKAQLGICFQNRYNPATLFVKEYLRDKQILSAYGEVQWHRDKNYYAQDAWRGKQETEGGGVLINQAIHTIDILQYFCGMPESVTAICKNRSLQGVINVEDTADLVLNGDKKTVLYATNAADKDYPVTITLKTSDAEIRMQSNRVWINGVEYDYKIKGKSYAKKVYGVGHRGLIYDFYDCIKSGRKFFIDGKEGAKALKIVLASYRSKGKEVKLYPSR